MSLFGFRDISVVSWTERSLIEDGECDELEHICDHQIGETCIILLQRWVECGRCMEIVTIGDFVFGLTWLTDSQLDVSNDLFRYHVRRRECNYYIIIMMSDHEV